MVESKVNDKFQSEFLTHTEESKSRYQQLLAEAAQIVATSLPGAPYCGKSPSALADLIDADFLPPSGRSSEEIAGTLRAVVSNSIAVSHPNTAAHLHCPPLLAALAAEVVISALNQSMDSFDQSPIATVVEQKLIHWLCAEARLPSTADGTFTTGGSQVELTWACCWRARRFARGNGTGPRRLQACRPKRHGCASSVPTSPTSPWKSRRRNWAWEATPSCAYPWMKMKTTISA